MRDLLSGLLGVPATILLAAGLGIAGLTVGSRLRGRREPPMRMAHLALGLALLVVGALLLSLDVGVVGVR